MNIHEPWMDDALCTQTDPDAFFPEEREIAKEAKKVCASCPVISECLTYALNNRIDHGIWGGLTTGGRNKLRKVAA